MYRRVHTQRRKYDTVTAGTAAQSNSAILGTVTAVTGAVKHCTLMCGDRSDGGQPNTLQFFAR